MLFLPAAGPVDAPPMVYVCDDPLVSSGLPGKGGPEGVVAVARGPGGLGEVAGGRNPAFPVAPGYGHIDGTAIARTAVALHPQKYSHVFFVYPIFFKSRKAQTLPTKTAPPPPPNWALLVVGM